jgi:hypothetical protein
VCATLAVHCTRTGPDWLGVKFGDYLLVDLALQSPVRLQADHMLHSDFWADCQIIDMPSPRLGSATVTGDAAFQRSSTSSQGRSGIEVMSLLQQSLTDPADSESQRLIAC